MEENNNKKKIMIPIVFVLLLVIAVVGVTYAFFNYTRTGSTNTLRTGRIYFSTEQTNNNTINLTNIFPMTKEQALADTSTNGTLVVTFTGDTTYTDGIEYLLTIDDVTRTANVPISLIMDVNVTTTATGSSPVALTENANYYTAREAKTASMYKAEGEDTTINSTTHKIITDIETGKYLLAGYIKSGNDVVNGTVTIKAFIDTDNILITDTPNDQSNAPTGYTDGTVTTGKTVISTTDWNSLQSTGVSFKIKGEANEGIWVEEPAQGTIESCPNCKFIYSTNDMWTTWNTASQSPTILTSGYSTNYNDIVTSSGKNYFLGVVTNVSNQITNAYACGIYNGTTPFCIEGSADGANYSSNSSFINGSNLWNNTCTVESDYTECGSWDGSSVSADARSPGDVDAGVSYDYVCYVSSNGVVSCSESDGD